MDLPNLLKQLKSHQEEPQRFLAIEISPSAVKTSVWYLHGHSTKVETIGSIQSWDNEAVTDLVEAIHTSLSAALSGIDPQPNQVIFGLPETWVGESNISQNKKPLLKQICSQLALKPVGFVVTTEAIIHYLHETEGGPPSGILIKVESDQIIVSLVRLGVLQGAQVVGRSPSISSDVEEGLARFPETDDIPSRMILYDSKENIEDLKQELISHDWQARLPFLHFPKIESLSKDASIKAIAIAGGSEVAQSLGLIDQNPQENSGKSNYDYPSSLPPAPPPPPIKTKPEIIEATKDKDIQDDLDDDPDSPPDLANEFGFTTFEINAVDSLIPDTETEPGTPPTPPVSTKPLTLPSKPEPDLNQEEELVPVDPETFSASGSTSPPLKRSLPKLSFNFLKKLSFKPRLKRPSFSSPGKKLSLPSLLLTGIAILTLLIIGGGLAYWHLPKATVTIYVNPTQKSKELTFNLDTSITAPDLENNLIPATLETMTASGDGQTLATGTKTIGDRAIGRVALYNRTSSPKTFPAGTDISYQNYGFTLDESVTVASASATENADFTLTIQPSKAEVGVTAVDIGSQYNLGTDTQFDVANFSTESFVAKAVIAFTGGSSQEVSAVSRQDLEDLKNELIKQLETETATALKAKSNSDTEVLITPDYEITQEDYSADIGEQTDNVNLTLTINQNAYVYSLNNISLLAQKAMLAEIPPGYTLNADKTTVEVIDTQINDDNQVSITAKTTLSLSPVIDTQKISENIKGKYPPLTEGYFKTLPNFDRTEVKITPPLPSRLNTFPRKPGNITLQVQTNP